MPQDRPRAARTPDAPKPAVPANALGLGVSDVSAERLKELGVRGGVQVDAVDGLAASAGLRTGDIITQMNSNEVQNARQFNDMVAKLDPKKDVAVLVRRGEASRFVIIRR
jgi:serine protease Do